MASCLRMTEHSGASQACRIVVCDDVEDYRALLVMTLTSAGGCTIAGQAANGQEAIDMVRKERPDVLLLDVAMPVMDGLEALPHIRLASPETRVIVLTGFASDRVRERALESGAAAFLEKGARPQDIIAAVRAVRAA